MAAQCDDAAETLRAEGLLPAPDSLDLAVFHAERARFLTALENGEKFTPRDLPSNVEGRLALLDAMARQGGAPLFSLEQLMTQGDQAALSALKTYVEGMNLRGGVRFRISLVPLRFRFASGFSSRDVQKIVDKTYELGLFAGLAQREAVSGERGWTEAATGLLGGAKARYNASIDRLIEERVVKELASSSFETALDRLGFMRGGKSFAVARAFKKRYSAAFDAAFWAAINLPFTAIFQLPPAMLPKIALTRGKQVPDKLLAKVREQGFEAAREELRELYGSRPHFDLAFAWGRRLYGTAIRGLVAVYLVHAMPMIRFSVEASFVTEKDIYDAQQRRTVDDIRAMHLEAWEQSFVAFEGQPSEAVRTKAREWASELTAATDTREFAKQHGNGLGRVDRSYLREYLATYQKFYLKYDEATLRLGDPRSDGK